MAKVNDIARLMRRFAPEELAEDYDNVGLLFGSFDSEVNTVLCCLDLTDEVLSEAEACGAELIITHHPPIFSPLKRITSETVLGRKLLRLGAKGISVYSAHTNLDFAEGGINDYVSELVGLRDAAPLIPGETRGIGRVGNIAAIKASSLRDKAAAAYGDGNAKLIGKDALITRVAVINGAGGGDVGIIDAVKAAGAQCLITSEIKHHVVVYAGDTGVTLIETSHYSSENVYIQKLAQRLRDGLAEQGLSVRVLTAAN